MIVSIGSMKSQGTLIEGKGKIAIDGDKFTFMSDDELTVIDGEVENVSQQIKLDPWYQISWKLNPSDEKVALDYETTSSRPFMKKHMNHGEWKTREGEVLKIAKMQTKHILNCIKFLERKMQNAPNRPRELCINKIQEFKDELKNRKNEHIQITKHVIEIKEEDFVQYCKDVLGVKIPESGAGVYVNGDGNKWRLGTKSVTLEFDTQKKLASKHSSLRKTSKTKRKASKRRA
jgi:hypothetical protein